MKLIVADKLTPEQRRKAAVAARKVRPAAKYRAEFRRLRAKHRATEAQPDHSKADEKMTAPS
jgi:hypothetical protein